MNAENLSKGLGHILMIGVGDREIRVGGRRACHSFKAGCIGSLSLAQTLRSRLPANLTTTERWLLNRDIPQGFTRNLTRIHNREEMRTSCPVRVLQTIAT
jgi:hypothetical protein